MADTTRNIFSLSEYSDYTIAGDGIPIDSVFLKQGGAGASSGYVTRGGVGYPAEFKKADMSTDTFTTIPAAFPGPSGSNRDGYGAGATKDAIVFAGGNATPAGGGGANGAQSNWYKTPFATDTITLQSGNFSSNRYDIGGTSNGSNGAIYFYAGFRYGGSGGSDNAKLMTPTGTFYSLDQNFPTSDGIGSVGGTPEKGFIMGKLSSNTTNVWDFPYTTEYTSAMPGAAFPTAGKSTTTNIGTANNTYVAGFTDNGNTKKNWIQQLNHSAETTSTIPGATLADASSENGGIGNYTTHGYILGANTISSGSKSYIQKFVYTTDTVSLIPAVMQSNSGAGNGRSGSENGVVESLPKVRFEDNAESTPNYSWFAGGSPNASTVDRLDMTTDTTDYMSSMTLNSGGGGGGTGSRQLSTNQASSPTTGYYFGSGHSEVRRLHYSSQTESWQPGTTIPGATGEPGGGMTWSAAAGHSTAGYIMGGAFANTPWNGNYNTRSWVNKINYSSGGVNRIPSANLTSVPNEYGTGDGTSAVSSSGDTSGAAYLVGGQQWPSQGIRSNVWKMSYSTDTTTAVPSFVPTSQYNMTGHSEKSAGYFGGGSPTPSGGKMYKFPWATETFTHDGGDSLHRDAGSGGNQQAAYQGAGAPSSNNSSSSYIKKFTYATSTTSTLTARYSAGNKTNVGGMGALTNNLPSVPAAPPSTPTPSVSKENHTYGIYRQGSRTDFQKIDFSTGSTSTIPGSFGTMVASTAVSDDQAIYTSDWNTAGRSFKSDWSTQTTKASPGTWSTSVNPYFVGRFSTANMSQTKGYFTGGRYPSISPSPNNGVNERRQHIVFATGTGVSEGNKAEDYIYYSAGSDSATRGYMYGGYNYNEGGTSKITYMNFATDGSFNATPGTPTFTLAYNRAEAAVVGNKDKAYIAGTAYSIPGVPAAISRIEKFTYSTETRQTMPSLNTPSSSNRGMAATGDQEKGYWAGAATNPNSFVITYATESMSGTPNYPNRASDNWAISQAQNAQPGYINVPVSVL